MPTMMPVPPALAPLIGCTLALCSLWMGWRIVRTLTIPSLLEPMIRLNTTLKKRAEEEAERPSTDTVRVIGWAWIYAGTLGLIIAGGQLARLMAGGLG